MAGTSQTAAPLPVFRRQFRVEKPVRTASLRISGLGQFEAHINGANVTTSLLTPGWTDYSKHVFYDSYDITAKLHAGDNAIGVMLGNGWYNVVESPGRYTKFARSFGKLKLIAQIDITYSDGTESTIATDASWKTAPGPITYSSIYGGEDYDARLEEKGWDGPLLHDSDWTSAVPVDGPGGQLVPETIPPVRAFESYAPVAVTHPQPGVAVYDLGQNFAGWPEITVTGTRGSSVKLVCGELLDKEGRVSQKSANAFPDSQNSFLYVLRGAGMERWSPRFTYYGFRYVEVRTQGSAPVRVVRLRGRFLHDAVAIDGHFSSSDPLVNRIHLLINRAMLSNMVSVLTDCPHREKLGWLEQTHLAGSSLMYNYGLESLYAKMSQDMEDAQLANGMVPDIAPEYPVFDGPFRDSPEWGAAVVLSPWTAYQFYGDAGPLRTHYESMKRYMSYLDGHLKDHLLSYGLGDWYDIGPGDPGESKLTAKGLTATAIYFQMLTAMSRIASMLDHREDAERFSRESETIKDAFNRAFLNSESGYYDRGSQTAQAMPLVVGLVPEHFRSQVLANLIKDIRGHSNHVTAGDIGFHYVVRALTDNGRSDVLYEMLSRTDKPSYGDQLARGATTLTEAWDANPNSSQNHFMLGHAEEWFYRGLAGIDFDMSRDPDARIRIEPAIVGDIRNVEASFQSRLGKITSEWKRSGDVLSMTVAVPEGTNATVVFPTDRVDAIREDGHLLREGGGIRRVQAIGGEQKGTLCVIAGGTYHFTVSLAANRAGAVARPAAAGSR